MLASAWPAHARGALPGRERGQLRAAGGCHVVGGGGGGAVWLGCRGGKRAGVASTWGRGSLLARHRDLLPRLAGDLPGERYRVAAIVHPNVWHWHGPRQVTVWYADCVRRGLILVRPEDGWRGVLAASDVVIGDHGAVTCYATAGVPVLLASYPDAEGEPS